MADEDEVDVEGDFDMNMGAEHEALPNLYLDMNEPPSKSVNLLPEYTQHPWMLEQGWSLDHCTDEKSKAAIEKMLQEEQQYMNGRVTVAKVMAGHTSTSIQKQPLPQTQRSHTQAQSSHPLAQRRVWMEEERQSFQKGLALYGRSWSRIAALIPDKTTQQVKSFGQHYFKIKAREEEDRYKEHKPVVKTQLPIGIQHAIHAVTTAQPTIKVSPKKLSTYYDSASLVWPPSNAANFKLSLPTSTKSRKEAKRSSAKHASPPKGRRGRPPGRPPKSKDNLKDVPNNGRVAKVKLDDGMVNTELEVSSLIASSEVVRIPRADDSDADVDIDVDDDDGDMDTGGEVGDTVYRALVESAGIMQNPTNGKDQSVTHPEHGGASSSEADSDAKSEADNLDVDSGAEANTSAVEDATRVDKVVKSPLDEVALPVGELLPVCATATVEDRERPGLYGVLPQAPPEQLINESKEVRTASSGEDGSVEHNQEEQGDAHTRDMPHDKDYDVNSMRPTSHADTDESSLSEDDSEAHPNEFGILTSLGDLVWLANPVAAVTLPRDVASKEEQMIHCEFFTHNPRTKTPNRYLRIRNFILDAWEKCRPQYLNKTSVRPGLKNCGDVNCIGRIHAYLEQVGAINYGCSQVQYLRTCRSVPVKMKLSKDGDQLAIRNDMPSRKRRVRDFEGQWVDERDLEGKTIEHKVKVRQEKRQRMVRLHTSYDPFKLNTCLNFSQEQPAPFRLVVESLAAVTMDVHAHMAKTEVIGLLGGRYVPGECCLTVTVALPCESLSTGMQCEMDPVSQSEACEAIERQGYVVVGWYHSHPTFIPDPSCRDIETQQKYQDWFGKGGSPFVGVIISPYCHGQLKPCSITRCLVMLNTPPANIGRPYQFEYSLSHTQWDTARFREQVAQLAKRYSTYRNCVHLLHHYTSRSDLTCLQKLVESLSSSFPESPPEGREFLRQLVEEIITTNYREDGEKIDQELDEEDGDGDAGDGREYVDGGEEASEDGEGGFGDGREGDGGNEDYLPTGPDAVGEVQTPFMPASLPTESSE